MQPRITPNSLYKNCPRVVPHLTAMGEVPDQANLPKLLRHLVEIRVSQINGCAYCQHLHANEARSDGETQSRLDVLQAWREVGCFSPAERAALAWAENLTLLAHSQIDDADFETAKDIFGEATLIELTTIVLQINSWNRISVGFRFQPDFE